MRKLFVFLMIALLATALIVGCGQKADQEYDKTPPDVKEAESMDQTSMDEAVADSGVVDSLAGEVKEAVDEAAETLKDKAGH